MERKGLKTLANLLSKTAGLVFFSFLAISLGVVFGLLFDGWVKEQPGSPVDSKNTLETVELPITDSNNNLVQDQPVKENVSNKEATNIEKTAEVNYKVRVGPYASLDQAITASKKLQTMGYPVYVGKNPPFAVQVGAFGARNNAEKLKNELAVIGYKSFIEQ